MCAAPRERPLGSYCVSSRGALKRLPSDSTAFGRDRVCYAAAKADVPEVRDSIIALFQVVWTLSARPSSWGLKRALPLHKKGDVAVMGHYRVLAIGQSLSQWYEEVLLGRLRATAGQRLDPCQLGHRAATMVHVIALLETLRARARAGAETFLALIDF